MSGAAALPALPVFTGLQYTGFLPFHEPTKQIPPSRGLLFLLPGMLFLQAFAWLKLSLHSKLHSIITYVELSPNNICKTNAFTVYLLSCLIFLLLFYISISYLLCKLLMNKNFVLFTAVSLTLNDLCYGTSRISKQYLLSD